MTDLELRAHLGNFGLSGDIVLKPIGSFSGGQKTRFATLAFASLYSILHACYCIVVIVIIITMYYRNGRLAFAAVCLFKPHVLLLDEPTNNLSMDAINSLALACQEFEGAVVLVSHNLDFLCQVLTALPYGIGLLLE